MANAIRFAGTITPANTPCEGSHDGGVTYRPVPITTVGAGQEGILTNVPTGPYAAGVVKFRAVGYPATVQSAGALTITGPAAVAPTITSFAPASGAPGSTVVLTGTGFTGATVVSVNSAAVASFVVNSPTQITAVLTNAQASGLVRVTTANGTAVSAAAFTVTAAAAPIGDVFRRTNFADFTGMDIVGGAGWAVNAGKLTISNGNGGSFARIVAPSGLDQFTVSATARLQADSANDYGLGIKLESANSAVNNSLIFYVLGGAAPADQRKLAIYDYYANTSRTGPLVAGLTTNQDYELKVEKTALAYTFTVTTGGQVTSMSVPILYTSGAGDISTNTFRAVLGNAAGSYEVTAFSLASPLLKAAPLAVGDSISFGFNAGSAANRWATKAGLQVQSGPGDRTTEVLLRLPEIINVIRPSKVYLMIGTNNANDTAYHNDLASIASQLAAASIPLVFVSPPARAGADMSGYRDYLVATYPGRVVDAFAATKAAGTNFLAAANDSGDGTHPNAAGHQAIASALTASGL